MRSNGSRRPQSSWPSLPSSSCRHGRHVSPHDGRIQSWSQTIRGEGGRALQNRIRILGWTARLPSGGQPNIRLQEPFLRCLRFGREKPRLPECHVAHGFSRSELGGHFRLPLPPARARGWRNDGRDSRRAGKGYACELIRLPQSDLASGLSCPIRPSIRILESRPHLARRSHDSC